MTAAAASRAALYRMDMDGHTCPFGLKAKALLKRQGFALDDHPLRTRDATESFKAEQGVKTTPQIFIDDRRIGGYDDLRRHLGKAVVDPKATTYKPVIAIFAMTALMALAASEAAYDTPFTIRAGEWFIAFSMCVLAIQKLQNVETFSSMFLGYDLLAKRWGALRLHLCVRRGAGRRADDLRRATAGSRFPSPCSSAASARCRCSTRSMSRSAN